MSKVVRRSCPFCGAQVSTLHGRLSVACPSCDKMFPDGCWRITLVTQREHQYWERFVFYLPLEEVNSRIESAIRGLAHKVVSITYEWESLKEEVSDEG